MLSFDATAMIEQTGKGYFILHLLLIFRGIIQFINIVKPKCLSETEKLGDGISANT